MQKAILSVILLLAISGGFYLLYVNGFIAVNAKRALSFVGSMRGRRARFNSCSGYVRRVVRFKEGRVYRFALQLELSKGEVTAELCDPSENAVMRLNSENAEAFVEVEQGKRYSLTIRFENATGSYALDWE